MARALPIGVQDFKKIRDSDYLYIDKTDMISQILSEGADAYLYTRPRRFGKSLNLSMLDAFFNLKYSKDNKWFDGLKVSECKECQEYKNAYPVIYFDFKDLDARDFDMFIERLSNKMRVLYSQYRYLKESDDVDEIFKIDFDNIISGTPSISKLMDSLNILSRMLYAYHDKKVIILLDEYDNPMHNAYGKVFHKDIVDVMKGILSSVLKGDESLMFGVITGVMQISKENIFSGLNNLEVNNIFSKDFDEMFGFTNGEVKSICEEYGHPEKYDEAKEWYDGYRFGGIEVYNPWSILKYVKSGFDPQAYWAGTSGNSIIETLFDISDNTILNDLRSLAENKAVVKTIKSEITFDDLDLDSENIYSVMVMSGYLKAIPADGGYEISLPNKELFEVFASMLATHLRRRFGNSSVSTMIKALAKHITSNNAEAIQDDLYQLFASTLAAILLKDENAYQLFLTGVLLQLSGKYEVKADFENGKGRYDILLRSNAPDLPHVVIELKRTRSNARSETVEANARDALEQIKDRDYTFGLNGNIILYGIAFKGKEAKVVSDFIVR